MKLYASSEGDCWFISIYHRCLSAEGMPRMARSILCGAYPLSKFKISKEDIAKRVENLSRTLHPLMLLVNVCGPAFDRPSGQQLRICVGGGRTDRFGHGHPEASAYPQLQTILESDERFQLAVRKANSLGLRNGRFERNGCYFEDTLEYVFDIDDQACNLIRNRAFKDKDQFPGDADVWEESFDLYLRQNWIKDHAKREYYRTKFGLVEWPPAPRELWDVNYMS